MKRKTNLVCEQNWYTVELQWLKHLWNKENMFETGVVQASELLIRAPGQERK